MGSNQNVPPVGALSVKNTNTYSLNANSYNSRQSLMPNRLSIFQTPVERHSICRGPTDAKMKDKQSINDNLDKLWNFLCDHSYPQKISIEQLKRPSSRDFGLIFEFLFKLVDPNFVLSPTQPGVDIAATFKGLGYPFSITKSAYMNAGAPHTWPALLTALVWLVDLLEHDKKAISGVEKSYLSRKVSCQELLDFCIKSYPGFLESGEERDEESARQLKEKYARLAESEKKELERQKEMFLEFKRKNTELEENGLKNVAMFAENLMKENQAMVNRNAELERHLQSCNTRELNISAELESLKIELQKLEKEEKEISIVLATQEKQNISNEGLSNEMNQYNNDINIWKQKVAENKKLQEIENSKLSQQKLKNSIPLKSCVELLKTLLQHPSNEGLQVLAQQSPAVFQNEAKKQEIEAFIKGNTDNCKKRVLEFTNTLRMEQDKLDKKKCDLKVVDWELRTLETQEANHLKIKNECKKQSEQDLVSLMNQITEMEQSLLDHSLDSTLLSIDNEIANKKREIEEANQAHIEMYKEIRKSILNKQNEVRETKKHTKALITKYAKAIEDMQQLIL
uniref:Kinetochore protein NDC80 n=1 Tax=Arcella intermedia TaxID=1963864 RepID=A0A6B2L0N6_9EUKA